MPTDAEMGYVEPKKRVTDADMGYRPSTGPGYVGAFKRGVYSSPMFQNEPASVDPVLAGKAGFAPPSWNTGGMTDARYAEISNRNRIPSNAEIAQSIPAPTNFGERFMQRVGQDSPFLVGNVAGGAGFGANTAKNLVIQFMTSDASAQYAEDKGFGALGQFLASIAGGAAGGMAANRFDSAARSVAGRLTGTAGEVALPQLSGDEVTDIAKKFNVSRRSVREAAKTASEMFIDDPTGQNPSIDNFKSVVEDATRIFKGSGTMPSSAQLAGKLGAEDIVGRETKYALSDGKFRRALGGQKAATERFLNDQWDSLVPNGSSEGLVQKAAALDDEMTQAKAALSESVNFDEIPKSPVAPLKSALEKIDQRPAYAKFVPGEIRSMIEDAKDGEISALHLQDIKARLGGIIADGKQRNADEAQRAARVAAGKLQEVVVKTLNDLPEGEANSAYRALVDKTSEYYGVFDPESVAIKSIRDLASGDRIAKRIMGTNDPVAELRSARKMLDLTEGGMDDLKAVFADQLTGGDLERMNAASVFKKFTSIDGERFYRELYGDAYEPMRDTLKGFEWGRRFTGGTPGNIVKTQSALPHFVEKGIGWISSPVQSLKRAPVWVAELVAGDIRTQAQQEMLIKEALRRPELLVQLAEMPGKNATQADVSKWVNGWKSLVAAAKSRDLLRNLSVLGANRSAITASNAMGAQQMQGQAQPVPNGGVR